MVEVDFNTKDMIAIEYHLNNYFAGNKPPKTTKETLKLLKKINIIRETFEECDEEDKILEDE